jgi:glycosyltransferase involved in cell wall biosynthesis
MEKAINPVRILHITFNMSFGGTEQVIRQLASNLDRTLFHSEIACIDGEIGKMGLALESQTGIKHHSRKRRSGFDLKTVLWLRRLIKNGKFDIVHCHQYSPYIYGWFAHWGTGARVVFTEHGRFHPDRYRTKARWINPLIARTTHKIVAISAATSGALVEYEYLPANKIEVIYNGISPVSVDEKRRANLREELSLKPEQAIIGTVARLDSVKNQAMILQALRKILDLGFNVHFLLVGDGPERAKLQTLAAELQLEESVTFAGFQPQPSEYLSLMDVFLLPSFTEGTSMTLLEAMSLGIPTVATRVGGTPEIVTEGETGLLIESNDLTGFTSAIQLLLENPDRRSTMAQQAKRSFEERFSAQQMVEQYEYCYR